MQKFLYVIVCTLLFFSCSRPADEPAGEKIEIKFWINPWMIKPPGFPADQPVTADAFPRWAAEEFMRRYPEVEIKYIIVSNREIKQKIAAALAAGTPPDIFKYFDLTFAVEGLLEPIDDYLTDEDKEDYINQALEFGAYNGKHYMWPWNYGTNGMGASLLVNRERFRERGIDVDNIIKNGWTVDQFLEICKQLSYDENGDGKNDKYALALGAKDELNLLNFMYIFGARLFDRDEKKVILNSPEAVKALTFLRDLVDTHKVCVPGVEGLGFYDIVSLFHGRTVAIGFGGPYEIGRIYRYQKKGKIKDIFIPAVVPYPHLPGQPPTAHISSGGFIVFKQQNKRKREYVMKFGKFLTSPETLRLLESLYYVTARKSANARLYQGDVLRPQVESYVKIIETYGTSITGSEKVHFSAIKKYLRAMFEAVFFGNNSPRQAVDEFAETANTVQFRVVR